MKIDVVAWVTPPENQGQVVDVSYGFDEGRLVRRVHDKSSGGVWYAVCTSPRITDNSAPQNCDPGGTSDDWEDLS